MDRARGLTADDHLAAFAAYQASCQACASGAPTTAGGFRSPVERLPQGRRPWPSIPPYRRPPDLVAAGYKPGSVGFPKCGSVAAYDRRRSRPARSTVKNPSEEAAKVRAANRSYVFFRVTGLSNDGEPIGAQGVPLTPGRSIAVDRVHEYGTPFFIEANLPIEGGKPASLSASFRASSSWSRPKANSVAGGETEDRRDRSREACRQGQRGVAGAAAITDGRRPPLSAPKLTGWTLRNRAARAD